MSRAIASEGPLQAPTAVLTRREQREVDAELRWEVATDKSVLEDLRLRLARDRRAGIDFELASREATSPVHDPDWLEALRSIRPAWEGAYDGRPAASGEAAFGRIVPGRDGVGFNAYRLVA